VYVSVYASVGDSVYDSVGDSVYDSVYASVGDSVYDSVRASVYASVGDSVYDSVRASVGDSVRANYEIQIKKTILEIAKKYNVKISWNYWLGGQFWVGGWWGAPSYVSFFTDVCGLELDKDIQERATAYSKICESVNYIWPNRDFIIVCARPKWIERDEKDRLHSLKHQAIEYPDGWGLYMIHGVRFQKEEFEKFTQGKMDAIDIMNEKNQDKKRVMIMEYGNEKLIKELKAVLVAEELDDQNNSMKLWKIDREDDTPMIFYEAIDPSKNEKIYLRMPPEFENRTPSEAKCWSFKPLWDLYQNKEKFKLLQET
jgi:hypothetical protein